MATREAQIVLEAGRFWVLEDRQGGRYTVLLNMGTHAVSDSSYPLDDDGLSLAAARCNYLARRDRERHRARRV